MARVVVKSSAVTPRRVPVWVVEIGVARVGEEEERDDGDDESDWRLHDGCCCAISVMFWVLLVLCVVVSE